MINKQKRQEDKISILKNTISALTSELELVRKDVDFYKGILDLLERKSEELTPSEFKQFFDEEIEMDS